MTRREEPIKSPLALYLTKSNHVSETMDSAASTPAPRQFVIGSRASKLAVIQAEIVLDALTKLHPDTPFTLSFMTTAGDKNQSQALYLMGGKSLWTKELEVGLLDGDIDLIVHSLKDVPTTLPDGCELGAILEREDPSDCLVMKADLPYKSLDELPDGSVIGTSSVRRVAQLRRVFPKLRFADVVSGLALGSASFRLMARLIHSGEICPSLKCSSDKQHLFTYSLVSPSGIPVSPNWTTPSHSMLL